MDIERSSLKSLINNDELSGIDHKLSVYPVPCDDILNIVTSGTDFGDAFIFDAHGVLILNLKLIPGEQQPDLSDFSPGIYFLNSANSSMSFIKK